MQKQGGCLYLAMFFAVVILVGCGEDDLLMGEIDQLQKQIDHLSDKADSVGDGNERLMAEIDQLQKVIADGIITAEEFRILDENGKKAAVFGGGSLNFYNEDGELGTTIDYSNLTTFSVDTFVIDAFVVEQQFIDLYDDNGNKITAYLSSSDNEPHLVFINDEETMWSIPLELPWEPLPYGSGSGFLLTRSGLVVTNHHVIEDSLDSDIEVEFPQMNASMKATVLIQDKVHDLAILELDESSNFVDIFNTDIPYQVAASNTLNVGEEVFALGSPLQSLLGKSTKVSTGTVSSTDVNTWQFQISNPIQPGNSGGPVFDSAGRLVGVVVSGLNDMSKYARLNFIPQNVNFAIKGDYLVDLINRLPEIGRQWQVTEIANRPNQLRNQLAGKTLEEQVEMLLPFMAVIKAW